MAAFVDVTRDGFAGAFADFAAVNVNAGHARLRGKGMEDSVMDGQIAAAEVVAFLSKDDDGAAFGSFVGERGKLSSVGEIEFFDAGRREGMSGGAIAKGDGAGF